MVGVANLARYVNADGAKAERTSRHRALVEERTSAMWAFERSLVPEHAWASYAGVDEAGRGALAGPVVAAAVILGGDLSGWIGVNDSKQMTRKRREVWYEEIHRRALSVGVGLATVEEIDRLNILHASRLAMGRALRGLPMHTSFVLADGPYLPLDDRGGLWGGEAVVDGDARCLSIAAASIVAKVERDRMMEQLSTVHPNYGFAQHVGYGTQLHLARLREFGPCQHHRESFAPVRQLTQVRLNV